MVAEDIAAVEELVKVLEEKGYVGLGRQEEAKKKAKKNNSSNARLETGGVW